MSISLNHHLTRQKAQDDENHRRNREALRRKHEQGLQAILDRPVPPPSVVHSSSGRSAIIPGFFDDASAQAKPEEAPRRKIDKASLHPDVLAKTGNLSLNDNALALFDLLSRAYLAANHSGLVDLSTSEIQRYLGVSEADAQAARAELLFHDLIVFQDSGMGDKGYRPRLKSNLW